MRAAVPASRATGPATSGARRGVYVAAGCLCVGVGGLGIVLPGLPTTVFLLAAAWLFARSSPRLHRRLQAHPRLGACLRAAESRAMPVRCKVAALASMWVGIGLACWALAAYVWAWGSVVALGLIGSGVILFWVRTSGRVQPAACPVKQPRRIESTLTQRV